MATSPELIGELQNQQAELTTEILSDILTNQKCWECLDKINSYSLDSGIVAVVTVHQIMGRSCFSEPLLPKLGDDFCTEDRGDGRPDFARHRIMQKALPISIEEGIFCKADLTGIFISHPPNNTHCERDDPLAIGLPTIKELNWWHGSGLIRQSVLGVISKLDDQKNIILCAAGTRQSTYNSNSPAWGFCGPGLGLSAKTQIGAMEQEGINIVAIVCDNVFSYNRQIKQAIDKLSPVKV